MMLCKEKLTKNAWSCTTYFIRQFLFGIDPFFHKCVTHHIKWACPEQDRKVGGYVNVLWGIDFFLLNFETVSTVWYVFFYFIIPYDMLLDFSVSLKKAKKQIFGP